MKFLIIDDDEYIAKKIKNIILEYINIDNLDIDIYNEIPSSIHINDYSACFLDIEVGDKSGLDFASYIRTQDSIVPIIFITSFKDYWNKGYEYEALWYIYKPELNKHIYKALDLLKKELKSQEVYTIDYAGVVAEIRLSDINYVDKKGNYIYIHTDYDTYKDLKTISEFEAQVVNIDLFIHTTHSILIRKELIKSYNHITKQVRLKNGETKKVSRSYVVDLKKYLKH